MAVKIRTTIIAILLIAVSYLSALVYLNAVDKEAIRLEALSCAHSNRDFCASSAEELQYLILSNEGK